MTQEDMHGKVFETLAYGSGLDRRDDDDSSSVCSERTSAVRNIIMRFERGLPLTGEDYEDSQDTESSDGGRTPNFINPMTNQLSPLFLNTPNNRTSVASVNSILSGVSEISFASGSSGVGSDRRSDSESRARLTPLRPAPPPPEQFADTDSCVSRSPPPDDEDLDKRFTFTPLSSPVVLRRSRQPPVMRRKSLAESQKDLGVHWSYGVTQGDLEKLLRIRRRLTDEACEGEEARREERPDSGGENEGGEEPAGAPCAEVEGEGDGQDEEACADAASTDRSTDTLIDDAADDSDSLTVASDLSDRHSNIDNVSIRSISSLDRIPYQNYEDGVTVSSDEYGSVVCHMPDSEFLSVSAVNEWCVSQRPDDADAPPAQSKREKYRRLLTERVNELIHTEGVYTERLRRVVDDYMPELERADAPAALRGARFDVFANVDRLHRFHAEVFLPDLRAAERDLRKLGQCFRRHEQKFTMYVIYSRNNKRANRLVYEHKKFFQEKQAELGDPLDLSSYILEPIQRIPRYKLFLDDLVKTYRNFDSENSESDSLRSKNSESDSLRSKNSDSDSEEETTLQSLQLAKQMIETLLVTVDDIIALESIRDCPLNLMNQGKLLRQHEFLVTDPSRRKHYMRVFLFEKIVLLTVVYKKQLTVEIFLYRDHIPVDELGITPKENDLLKFTVWYRKRNIKNYKLETSDPGVRADWVQEITGLLWKQALSTKELVMQNRSARNSVISVNSQQSSDGDQDQAPPGDKYNSLRGVPGEVRRARKNKKENRSTTWYFEYFE